MNLRNFLAKWSCRRVSNLCAAGLTLTISLLSLNTQAAIAESTFDNAVPDFDGWTGLSCPNPGICILSNSSLGSQFRHSPDTPTPAGPGGVPPANFPGNPDGFIYGVDPGSDDAARLVAPPKFRDNLNLNTSNVVADRRILSFDALVLDIDGTGTFDSLTAPVVSIESATGALVYYAPVPAESIWTSFSVPLWQDPSDTTIREGWDFVGLGGEANASENDFLTFGAITRLTIIGEWLNDDLDVDIGGLDNVKLSAVPVPAALPLMLSALAGFSFWRRRT